jgi:acyl-CoA dehydrogenase
MTCRGWFPQLKPARCTDSYGKLGLGKTEEIHMAIDFTLSDAQKNVQQTARDFAQNVLAPVVREAHAEPDPLRAFQKTKPAYMEAYKRGIAFGMLPKQYGGGGLTNVELILAAEEICAVDPGFACTILVNGLGLMPVWYWGTEEPF